MNHVTLKIGEMNCGRCAERLQRVLSDAAGVKRARVSFDTRSASVAYRPQTIGEAEIVALVQNAGFTAEKI